jgi:hypothetical protein
MIRQAMSAFSRILSVMFLFCLLSYTFNGCQTSPEIVRADNSAERERSADAARVLDQAIRDHSFQPETQVALLTARDQLRANSKTMEKNENALNKCTMELVKTKNAYETCRSENGLLAWLDTAWKMFCALVGALAIGWAIGKFGLIGKGFNLLLSRVP